MSRFPQTHRRRLRTIARRGFSALEVVILVGVTVPLAAGLFFIARAACGRLFRVVDLLVSWPLV